LICLASMILLILVTPFRSRISPRLRETRSCLRPIACPLELPGLTDRADEFLVRKPDKFFLRLRPRMATPRTRDDKKRRTHEASAGGGRGGRTRKPTRTCASVTDSASPWANTFAINMSRGIPMSCALASSKSSRSIAWVVQSTSPSTWTGQNQRRSLPHRRGLRSPVCAGGGLSTVMYPRRYGGRAAFQRSTAPTPW
jgi:hypothetical protein